MNLDWSEYEAHFPETEDETLPCDRVNEDGGDDDPVMDELANKEAI